jgi:tRNA threonylcarbamoyladenosine biosynthesis protein TsaE
MAASNPSSQQASHTFELTTKSVEDTQQFGERLGTLLQAGDVVALIGDLGSGKTTCIQGIAKGLGIDPSLVKSPTFVLLRDYPGRRVGMVPPPVASAESGSAPVGAGPSGSRQECGMVHVDGYRLEGEPQAVWLDLEWVFSPRKVTVIEWADRFAGCLPEAHLELRMAHKTTNQRLIAVIPHGPRAAQIVEDVRRAIAGRGNA